MSSQTRPALQIDDPVAGDACHMAQLGTPRGTSGRLRDIPLGQIHSNPAQPRKRFDDASLAGLADSIRERGVLQPIIVQPRPDEGFELIAGERRWRASVIAGIATIPALVAQPVDTGQSIELALIENIAREDLGVIDEARTIAALLHELDVSATMLARRLGRSRSDLAHDLAFISELAQERGAAPAVFSEPDSNMSRLIELRDQLGRLKANLDALPTRQLVRFDELEAEARALAGQRAQHAERLAGLGRPTQRLGRVHDPHADERAFLESALDLDDRGLAELRAERSRLQRHLGDPDQVRSERDGIERAICGVRDDFERTRETLIAREVDREPKWLTEALGARPLPEDEQRVWRRGGAEIAGYRLDYSVIDLEHPLGPEPAAGTEQHRAWERAAAVLGRAQRQLGVDEPARQQSLDIGLG